MTTASRPARPASAYTREGIKKLWVRTGTATQLFEVSPDHLYDLAKRGVLHPSRPGPHITRWKLAELEAHFERYV